ncbi:hypothetical protein EI555_007305, partial [Monodon monoceros]
ADQCSRAHANCTRNRTLVTPAHNLRGSRGRPAGIGIQRPGAGCSPLSSCRATPAPRPFSTQPASPVSMTLTTIVLQPLWLSAFHQPLGERDAPGRCFPARCPVTPTGVLGRNRGTSPGQPGSQGKGDQCGAVRYGGGGEGAQRAESGAGHSAEGPQPEAPLWTLERFALRWHNGYPLLQEREESKKEDGLDGTHKIFLPERASPPLRTASTVVPHRLQVANRGTAAGVGI